MERDEGKRKLKLWEILKKYSYVLLIAAIGAVLILLPKDTEDPIKTTVNEIVQEQPAAENATRQLEEEMEAILSKISGVGKVDVLLTIHSSRELVLAQDNALQYSGNTHAPDNYDRSSEPITVGAVGGGENVVVTQERYPQYRGALVVCQGGGNDAVRLMVTDAVAALTGLGSDRITVVKWQNAADSGT